MVVKDQDDASRARRLVAALHERRVDTSSLERQAEQVAQDAADDTTERELEYITEETGLDVWGVVNEVRGAYDSCVAYEILHAFRHAKAINKYIHLSDDIDRIYEKLDISEGSCGYFVFTSMDGGVDIDCITSHGKDGCYGDGATDALNGMGESGYYFTDVLLVSSEACAIMDEMEACFFDELAPSMRYRVEAYLEGLWQDEFDYQYEERLAELTDENEALPDDNRDVVIAELGAGGSLSRDADSNYSFESACGTLAITVPAEFVRYVLAMTPCEANAIIAGGGEENR